MMSPPKKRRWLRWLLIIILTPILLIVILIVSLYFIGWSLPDEYETHVKLTLNKSPEKVWAAIQDVEKYPVASSVQKVEKQPPENDLPVWIEDMGETKITMKTVESKEPEYLKRTGADSVVDMKIVSETALKSDGDGTLVDSKARFTLKGKTWHTPFFRVILYFGQAESGLKDYWQRVADGMGAKIEYK